MPFRTFPFARCTSAVADVALAACAFALPPPGAGNVIEIQLTPAGEFQPSDGRKMKVPAWRIDAGIAARAIAATNARKTRPVVDYEHQTLLKEENGQPAPAAGFITNLAWREGQGLFATVELTERATQYVRDGEYRYVSPVFTYHPRTGDVLDIRMAALTNTPAIDGMEPLALRAAASFGLTLEEDAPMNKLLTAIVAALALDATATEDQAIAALNAAKTKLDGYDGFLGKLGLGKDAKPEEAVVALSARLDESARLRAALGIESGATLDAAVAACTALKTKADTTGTPDPAKYVSVDAFESVKTELAALTAKHRDAEVAGLVDAGLGDGRLLAAQKDWAIELGKKDVAALTAYLESAQPIAALRGTQTRGAPPANTPNEQGLSADELAVCNATGIDPKDFAKAKAA
mgnify:CR=1 FL=1